jgi:pyridoxine 5'-phosphate synthase PdxJ
MKAKANDLLTKQAKRLGRMAARCQQQALLVAQLARTAGRAEAAGLAVHLGHGLTHAAVRARDLVRQVRKGGGA